MTDEPTNPPEPDPESTPDAAPENRPETAGEPAASDASLTGEPVGVEGANVELPSFQRVLAEVDTGNIDMLHDVELDVKIELGRTEMIVEDVLRLAEGSVVELDKLAGDPVDIYVNNRLVARGEVLVLNDNFCVRVNEIVGGVDEPEGAGTGASADSGGAARDAG